MQIQKVNAQQSPNFGTAYVSFDKDGLSQLSPIAKKRVMNILRKGVSLINVSDDLTASAEHKTKKVQISHLTDKIMFRFTHQDSKKEHQLVGIIKKLFGDGVIHTNVIENTAENAARIEAANTKQERWLSDLDMQNIFVRFANDTEHILDRMRLDELD